MKNEDIQEEVLPSCNYILPIRSLRQYSSYFPADCTNFSIRAYYLYRSDQLNQVCGIRLLTIHYLTHHESTFS